MIFKGQKALIPYKGDRRPLNVYRGSKKISGYTVESVAIPGSFTSEYNGNPAGFIIEGCGIQNGTPDVGEYIPINTAAGAAVTLGNTSFTVPETVTLTLNGTKTDLELAMASVGGNSDILEVDKAAKTVKYIKRVQTFVFDGGEQWYLAGSEENNYDNYRIAFDMKESALGGSPVLCTHLPFNQEAASASGTACGIAVVGCSVTARVPFVNSGDLTPWRTFLSGQFLSGTPLAVMFASARQTVYDISDTSFGQKLLEVSAGYGKTEIFAIGSIGAASLVKYYKFER